MTTGDEWRTITSMNQESNHPPRAQRRKTGTVATIVRAVGSLVIGLLFLGCALSLRTLFVQSAENAHVTEQRFEVVAADKVAPSNEGKLGENPTAMAASAVAEPHPAQQLVYIMTVIFSFAGMFVCVLTLPPIAGVRVPIVLRLLGALAISAGTFWLVQRLLVH